MLCLIMVIIMTFILILYVYVYVLGRLDDKDMSIFNSTYTPFHEERMKRFIGEQLEGARPGACTFSTDLQRNINRAGVYVAANATKGQATAHMQLKACSHTLSKHQTQPPGRLPLPVPSTSPSTDLNLNLITALVGTDSGERIVPIYEVTNAVTEMPTARTRSLANQIAKEFTHAINNTSDSISGTVACIRACDGIAPEPVRLGLGQGEGSTTDTPSHGKCVYSLIHIYIPFLCVYIHRH